MSGPDYAVSSVYEGYRIRETTQPEGEGMVVTHEWLKACGFGPPSRMNIQDIINAAIYNHEGGVLSKLNLNELGPRPFPRKFAVDGLARTRSGLVIAKR